MGRYLQSKAAPAQLFCRDQLAAAAAEGLVADIVTLGVLPHGDREKLHGLGSSMLGDVSGGGGGDLPDGGGECLAKSRRLVGPDPPEEAGLVLPSEPGVRQ